MRNQLGFLALCMYALTACDRHEVPPRAIARSSSAEAAEAASFDLTLTPVSSLPKRSIADVLIEIFVVEGAETADRDDWPASFFSKSLAEKCTSTLVGARALLTAAHCVKDGGSVFIPNLAAKGTCTRAPDYRPNNKSADWALCLMEKPITGIPYERLNGRANILKKGNELLLTGFGCHDGGKPDGQYRIGLAKIKNLPTTTTNFIEMHEGAVVCFGDSGGPAFLLSNAETGPRWLAAVNSKRVQNQGVSRLASVTTQSARGFFDQWTERHGVAICGVTPGAQGCRQ